MVNFNAAINYVNNLGNSALGYVANNPGKSVGGFIVLDGFTNGFGMSQDMLDAVIANEGLAENSARAAAGEFGEILEETNDVAFNWSDMLTEGAQRAAGFLGETEDGNVLYGIAEGLNAGTDVLTDGEEIAYNSFTQGEFTWDTQDEWYETFGGNGEEPTESAGGEPSTDPVEDSAEMDNVDSGDSGGTTPDQGYDTFAEGLEAQDQSSVEYIEGALEADPGLVDEASVEDDGLYVDSVRVEWSEIDSSTEEYLRDAAEDGDLAQALSEYEQENL